mgnify:CR=1 FL=1
MLDKPLVQHCEDHALTAGSEMNESETSTRLGLIGAKLADELRERVRRSIMRDFGVEALYDSGALLTRLKADFEDDMFEVNHTHVYWCHY